MKTRITFKILSFYLLPGKCIGRGIYIFRKIYNLVYLYIYTLYINIRKQPLKSKFLDEYNLHFRLKVRIIIVFNGIDPKFLSF